MIVTTTFLFSLFQLTLSRHHHQQQHDDDGMRLRRQGTKVKYDFKKNCVRKDKFKYPGASCWVFAATMNDMRDERVDTEGNKYCCYLDPMVEDCMRIEDSYVVDTERDLTKQEIQGICQSTWYNKIDVHYDMEEYCCPYPLQLGASDRKRLLRMLKIGLDGTVDERDQQVGLFVEIGLITTKVILGIVGSLLRVFWIIATAVGNENRQSLEWHIAKSITDEINTEVIQKYENEFQKFDPDVLTRLNRNTIDFENIDELIPSRAFKGVYKIFDVLQRVVMVRFLSFSFSLYLHTHTHTHTGNGRCYIFRLFSIVSNNCGHGVRDNAFN